MRNPDTIPDGVRQARRKRLYAISQEVDNHWFASNLGNQRVRPAIMREIKLLRQLCKDEAPSDCTPGGYAVVALRGIGHQYFGVEPALMDEVRIGHGPGVLAMVEHVLFQDQGPLSSSAH